MSVSNQTNKIYGSGNGVTTTFSYAFKIFDVSELYAYTIVTATGVVTGPLTYNVDFTATISAVTEGGTITFVVAPPTGTTWFLKRVVPQTQSAVIPSEGVFPGKQFENQLDLLTMMAIQTNESVTRCLQLPTTYLGSLPISLPSGLANAAIGWDPTGSFLTNVLVTAVGTLPVPVTDNYLSPITTAGKVAGSALTGLSGTPPGAGILPAANIPTSIVNFTVPSGIIAMWSGSIATIPSGWVLCNGSNGTPDLRNSFILGADADVAGVAKSTYTGSATQTGGSLHHTHSAGTLSLSPGNGGIPSGGTSYFPASAGATGNESAVPVVYYVLAFIMKT